jgi:hypothetical protein
MLSQIHYLLRSKADGQYLAARVPSESGEAEQSYLLLFREHYEALSYLNTHAPEVADRFAVESIAATQLQGILQRWGYRGVGQVADPIAPHIQFLKKS